MDVCRVIVYLEVSTRALQASMSLLATCCVCLERILFGSRFATPFPPPLNNTNGGVWQNLISSKDGPVESRETRQRRRHTRRLPYYGTMAEKKDKKTTLYLLCVKQMYNGLLACFHLIPCFCTFYRSIPTWKEVLQIPSPLVHVLYSVCEEYDRWLYVYHYSQDMLAQKEV